MAEMLAIVIGIVAALILWPLVFRPILEWLFDRMGR